MKKIIATTNAPAAIGPYSQANQVNGMLFISGQLPIDPATGKFVEGGVAEQVCCRCRPWRIRWSSRIHQGRNHRISGS